MLATGSTSTSRLVYQVGWMIVKLGAFAMTLHYIDREYGSLNTAVGIATILLWHPALIIGCFNVWRAVNRFQYDHPTFRLGDVAFHPIALAVIGCSGVAATIFGVMALGKVYGWSTVTEIVLVAIGAIFLMVVLIQLELWWDNRKAKPDPSDLVN